jgi:uncharacterized protein (DUF983 family)
LPFKEAMTENYYPDLSPLKTGLAGKCPRCGRGRFFDGYLKVAKSCSSCGLSYSFADSGDGAAWFVMLIVRILGVEVAYAPPFWVHALIAVPVLIILPILLLRPMKAILLAQQWKTGAREGRQAE